MANGGNYERIALTIEILACRGLIPLKGAKKTDPYVKALFGSKRIHNTDKIVDSLSPEFSRDHKNAFILVAEKGELEALGLTLKIKTWRDLLPSKELGQTRISAEELLSGEEGDRLEFQIHKPRRIDQPAGVIAISCRPAWDKELFDYDSKSITIPRNHALLMSTHNDDHDEDDDDPMVALRIEILACRGLIPPPKNKKKDNKIDPYVKALFGTERIHSTERVANSLNPIFLPEHNASFVFMGNKDELEKKGLTLKIKDWRHLLPSKEVGQAHVPAKELLAAEPGDRLEFQIHKPRRPDQPAGVIAISCRRARDKDLADFYGTPGSLAKMDSIENESTSNYCTGDSSSSRSDVPAASRFQRTTSIVVDMPLLEDCKDKEQKRTRSDVSDELENVLLDPGLTTRQGIPQYHVENQQIDLLLQKLDQTPAPTSHVPLPPCSKTQPTLEFSNGQISEVAPNVYLVEGKASIRENVSSGKMIVVRKNDSLDLILINSLRLTQEGMDILDRLGNVKHIIRESHHEGLDDAFYQERYGATLSISN